MKYAEVLFQQKIGTKETLTYEIPANFQTEIGQAVEVKIRNRIKHGMILNIHGNRPNFRTSPITSIIQQKPILSSSQIKLLRWISDYYFCPLFQTFKLFIPKRILENKPIKNRVKEIPKKKKEKARKLTNEQQDATETIINSSLNTFLIHGITGSGKTEIYSRLAENIINKNKQALILVPEISLTPQTIQYFEKSIGIKAAVIHSKLSEGQRHKAWMDIYNEEAKLIIGSRSSIFAPFQNLGLIIIDEEHENSYKQDSSPRYSTHKVAEKIQEFNPDTKLIYASATPSIETKEKLKNSTIELKNRIGKSTLPEIEIVDLREEFKKQNYSIFSEILTEAITEALGKKEQIILFLNRRGSASSIVCRDCGYTQTCQNCEIPLTYHVKTLKKPTLICHHCGLLETPPQNCPQCKGINIRYLGIGTQKIEEEVHKAFPQAKTLRADKDTTSNKNSFKEIYETFKKHEADILIGTQMIAKGLHLPKVNLVGVILADIGLNMPDFRSQERNLQILMQVAGRAGRSGNTGKVIIQSYNPENISLVHSKNHDYIGFFNYERNQRTLLQNPPFSHLAKIIIEDDTLQKAESRSKEAENLLWRFARENSLTENLEISIYPAFLTRLRKKYRYIILIKDKSQNQIIHQLLKKLPEKILQDASFKIDIDPLSVV
ncbi:primosomal protein N' [Candidatus Peregrinibacteria bacterium]|nr:primosomal protein N' [Candidatus Peregrinibacteria bacterium]